MIEIVWGAGIGFSALAVYSGLRPPPPSLAEARRRITETREVAAGSPAATDTRSPATAWIARPATRLLARRGIPSASLRADLTLAGTSVDEFLTRKVLYATVGVLMPAAAQLILAVAGLAVPAFMMLAAGAGLGVWFFFVPDIEARTAARKVREETRDALETLLSFAATSMAGGNGIEAALENSAMIGDGAAFGYFRAATDAARTSRRPIWTCYAELAETLGVRELGELAATVNLAGGQGAKIAESLAAKAASLRGRRRADRQAANVTATERSHIPVSVMMFGFLLILVFPSLSRFLTKF